MHLWDVNGATELKVIPLGDSCRTVAFSPDGKSVACGTWGGSVKVWEVNSGKQSWSQKTDKGVHAIAYHPAGKVIAAGSEDQILLFDSATGRLLKQCGPRSVGAISLAYNSDGTKLASSHLDHSVRLWNAETGAEQRSALVMKHDNIAQSVDFSPDGHRLISAGQDGSVRLWDPGTGDLIRTFNLGPEQYQVLKALFSPEGRHFITANGNGTVYVIRLE